MNDYKKGDKTVFYTGDYYFGDNTIFAGTTGDDKMWISGRFSTIYSSSGNDIVSLVSSSNNSLVYTGAGNDFVGTNFTTNHTIYGGKGNDTVRFRVGRVYANGEDDNDTFVILDGANSVTCDGGNGNDRFWFIESASKISIAGGSGQDTYHFDPYYLFGPYHNDVIIKDISSDDIIRYDFEGTDGSELSYSKSNGNIVLNDSDNGFFTITLQGVTDISQVADVTYQGMDATKTLGEIFGVNSSTIDTLPTDDEENTLVDDGGDDDNFIDDDGEDNDGSYDDDDDYTDDEEEEVKFYLNDDETAVELFEDYDDDVFDGSGYENLKTIDGSAASNDIEYYGNDLKNSIVGGSGDDTFYGNGGNDTLKGGNGKDVFVYSSGDGNDIITDYTTGQDKIKLESGSITTSSLSGNDVVLKIGSGSIKVKNGKDKKITVIDKNGKSTTKVYGSTTSTSTSTALPKGLTYNSSKTMITASTDFTGSTINLTKYTKVKTLNASALTKKVTVTGNSLANSIRGGRGADTLTGGTGNDTLTGGSGKDVFKYFSGKDVITDYTAGQDKIVLTNGSISKVSIKGSDVVFTVGSKGTLTVSKGKNKKITIVDSNGNTTNNKYSTNNTISKNYVERDFVDDVWFSKDDNFISQNDGLESLIDDRSNHNSISIKDDSASLLTNPTQTTNQMMVISNSKNNIKK